MAIAGFVLPQSFLNTLMIYKLVVEDFIQKLKVQVFRMACPQAQETIFLKNILAGSIQLRNFLAESIAFHKGFVQQVVLLGVLLQIGEELLVKKGSLFKLSYQFFSFPCWL